MISICLYLCILGLQVEELFGTDEEVQSCWGKTCHSGFGDSEAHDIPVSFVPHALRTDISFQPLF